MDFKFEANIVFEVRNIKTAIEDFKDVIRNLTVLTVTKTKENEEKISVSLTTTQLFVCFNLRFWE